MCLGSIVFLFSFVQTSFASDEISRINSIVIRLEILNSNLQAAPRTDATVED